MDTIHGQLSKTVQNNKNSLWLLFLWNHLLVLIFVGHKIVTRNRYSNILLIILLSLLISSRNSSGRVFKNKEQGCWSYVWFSHVQLHWGKGCGPSSKCCITELLNIIIVRYPHDCDKLVFSKLCLPVGR